MAVLGLDIGGAHVKVADGQGYVAARPHALWKNPTGLARCLRILLEDAYAQTSESPTQSSENARRQPDRDQDPSHQNVPQRSVPNRSVSNRSVPAQDDPPDDDMVHAHAGGDVTKIVQGEGETDLPVAGPAGGSTGSPSATPKSPYLPAQLPGDLTSSGSSPARRLRTLTSDDPICVTMTGELADCFRTKAEGVEAILAAVREASESLTQGGNRPKVWVYLVDGRLVEPAEAIRQPQLAAASNWHALARFASRYSPRGRGLLIDIGSTTTDIIPLIDGQNVAVGRSDLHRLASGELVYTGVVRSPVAAVCRVLQWRDQVCPIAQELFATTQDAYLMLGLLPEDPNNCDTADNRPATKEYAAERLARMVCADRTMFTAQDAMVAARAVMTSQVRLLRRAVERVIAERLLGPPEAIVLTGQGDFLAQAVLDDTVMPASPPPIFLRDRIGSGVSRCATAHALAVLAREEHRIGNS